VSVPTRDRVAAAAARLGYVPSERGRSLSTRSTRQVAMVTDLDNPSYPALVAPLHDTLSAGGFRMVLLAERGDEKDSYERLFDGSIDGAVLTTPLLHSPLAGELHRRGVPFVQLNRSSDVVAADYVIADNHGGGRLVAELLLSLGHTRVGAVLGPQEASSARGREAGFRAALADAGIAPVGLVRPGSFTHDAGVAGFTALMAGPTPPTAVFCANDTVAIGALNTALRLGMAVPDDVTVVGFDDTEMAGWPAFALTTVAVPMPAMARRAAEVLLARMSGELDGPVQETFETRLVARHTHARPR
jgi:LacI family transcriptional regulator